MVPDWRQIRFDLIGYSANGGKYNPVKQMRELGFEIVACVPQTIADQWWFTVENLIDPLPPYLAEMEYDFERWHGEVR